MIRARLEGIVFEHFASFLIGIGVGVSFGVFAGFLLIAGPIVVLVTGH